MNISVFGTGYVGLVTGASLANLGHHVICVDVDPEKINYLLAGKIPFYEPGLSDLVKLNMEKRRLKFTVSAAEAVQSAEVIFNCVGTPEKNDGSADLQYVFVVAETVARQSNGYKVLINKSTVPPGTAKKCQSIVGDGVDVVSNPEFLKQGNAVYDFNHPDKIVLGAPSEKALEAVRRVYHGLIKIYIPLLETSWETAEMIKYANNCFLAAKISTINEIANIAGLVGADVKVVARALGMDQRIGQKFLNAGIGYGGSCFPKDVRALCSVAREHNYDAHLLKEVDLFNERQKAILVPKILNALQRVHGTTVSLWGLSFKPKTSDLRGAPSLILISELVKAGITVKVYDPVSLDETRNISGISKESKESILYCTTLEQSVEGSDAIILATEWDEFRNVDFTTLGQKMKTKIVFDGRNIYEQEQVREAGFEYYGVGR
ncbi:UDP-glucose/GDP-mannose dehydrogenase family protein [Candidatus Woesearchaeota archaeon]|nr:UDP-glucose/GDP-mannose dehydrogenase family protein [Candidatus Woesearchaeota archaeon]